eukprot:5669309-Amphidinium_carterae.2
MSRDTKHARQLQTGAGPSRCGSCCVFSAVVCIGKLPLLFVRPRREFHFILFPLGVLLAEDGAAQDGHRGV